MKWYSHKVRLFEIFLKITIKKITDFPALSSPSNLYIPEFWKRYPFLAEPPRIGHYRKYTPPPGNTHERRTISLQ